MISVETSLKRSSRKKSYFKLKRANNTVINAVSICSFKCSDCGETDEEIAEKYCGNSRCRYKK